MDSECVVSILNRTAKVQKDGNYKIFNVPAGVGKARVRATCKDSSGTHYGESSPLSILPNVDNGNDSIRFQAVLPVPTDIQLSASTLTLNSAGATAQLTVTAILPGGATKNVTSSDSGTTYLSTNRAVATVDSNGLVTAVSSGRVLVTASHESILKTLFITVTLGADSDGDGLPDAFETAHGLNPNDALDALVDLDGDGLSNLEEYQAATDLRAADTDDDGIRDGEETKAGLDSYVTNPLAADTDGDGIRDALEIQTGSNPTDALSRNLAEALQSLEVLPGRITFLFNTVSPMESTRQLAVTGRLKDGTTIDLTTFGSGTVFLTNNPAVAGFGIVSGLVISGSPGTATITVSNAGFSARVPVEVFNFFPRRVGFFQLPGKAQNLAISGSFAYVAAGEAGLHVVDLSNPTQPILVGTGDTPGSALDVWVEGSHAFVADSAGGLQILDISNPTTPFTIGAVALPGAALDVVVRNGLAYLADSSGLRIVNLSVLSAPVLVGSVDLQLGTAKGLDVSGSLAVIAAGTGGIMTFDVANPASPVFQGMDANVAGPDIDIRHVAIRGDLAVVANGNSQSNDAMAFDITDPVHPTRTAQTAGFAGGFDVDLDGSLAIHSLASGPMISFSRILGLGQLDFISFMFNFEAIQYVGRGAEAREGIVYQAASRIPAGQGEEPSGLLISRYLIDETSGSNAPTVAIIEPADGNQVLGADTIEVVVNAEDDAFVRKVELYLGSNLFAQSSSPSGNQYFFRVPIPVGTTNLALRAVAEDIPGNRTQSQTVTITVVPPPTTLAVGRIVDANGAPVAGANVKVGGNTSLSGTDGRFVLPDTWILSTRMSVQAEVLVSGRRLTGFSDSIAAVPASTTDFGDIVVRRGEWIYPDLGEKLTMGWENFVPIGFSGGFSFPFYGTTYDSIFVNAGGNLTFTAGDGNLDRDVEIFRTGLPRIAPHWGWLETTSDESVGIFYKQNPDYAQFTWKDVTVGWGGQRMTFQVVLYADGAIDFAFGKMDPGQPMLTGITPGSGLLEPQRDISAESPFTTAPNQGFYEFFNDLDDEPGQGFDLEYSAMAVDPIGYGSYAVSSGQSAAPSSSLEIESPQAGASAVAGSQVRFEVRPSSVFGIQSVELLVNGEIIRTLTGSPWYWYVDVPESGSMVLQARLVDNRGRIVISLERVVNIVQNLPPTATITSPVDGSSINAEETIELQAQASDDIGVDYVSFYRGNDFLGNDHTAPYTMNFTLPWDVGPIEFTVEAVDIYGLRTTSQPIQVNVLPGPLTTVIGQAVDTAGAPVPGANIEIAPNFTGISGADGRFAIPEVRANRPRISIRITKDDTLVGYAAPRAPVQAGETDFGIIAMRDLDSLDASWPFSGNAFDTTGYGHHGEVFGATLTPDRFGKQDSAYLFTQAAGFEYIQAGDMVVPATDLTFTTWIRIDAYSNVWPGYSQIMGIDGPDGFSVLRLGGEDVQPDALNFSLYDKRVIGATPLSLGTWYFVAVTLKENVATIYLNGNVDASQTDFEPWLSSGKFILGNGMPEWRGDLGLRGAIDDARLYRRALSPSEIQALYNQGGWPP